MHKSILTFALAGLLITSACSHTPSRNSSSRASGANAGTIPPATSPAVPPQVSRDNIERFYVVHGRRYAVMRSSHGFTESGTASWYGNPFHGRKTSNGEVYDMHKMTAAHKHLPLPSYVEVTNTLNGKKVVLRVNDRGPFVGDRVIDLSFAAARELDIIKSGTGPVRIRSLDNLNQNNHSANSFAADQPAFVQVASFKDHNNAFNYQKRLINHGIDNSSILQAINETGETLLRLQIGPINTGQEYDQLIKKLNSIGIRDTLLVRD